MIEMSQRLSATLAVLIVTCLYYTHADVTGNCTQDLELFIQLQYNDSAAMWLQWGTQPSDLGNYKGCTDIGPHAQYCWVGPAQYAAIGSCVPSACDADYLLEALEDLGLQPDDAIVFCPGAYDGLPSGAIAVITTLAFFACLMVAATVLDLYFPAVKPLTEHDIEKVGSIQNDAESAPLVEGVREEHVAVAQRRKPRLPLWRKLLGCFSLVPNMKSLLAPATGNLTSLNGMRALSYVSLC